RMVRIIVNGRERLNLFHISRTAVNVEELRPRVDAEGYRANLIKMVEWARQHESVPYFILLGDNSKEAEVLRRGLDHLKPKNYEGAIRSFALIPEDSWLGTLAKKYLSIVLRVTGRI